MRGRAGEMPPYLIKLVSLPEEGEGTRGVRVMQRSGWRHRLEQHEEERERQRMLTLWIQKTVLLKEIERIISLLHTQSITEPVPEKLPITYLYTLFYLYIWFLLETWESPKRGWCRNNRIYTVASFWHHVALPSAGLWWSFQFLPVIVCLSIG